MVRARRRGPSVRGSARPVDGSSGDRCEQSGPSRRGFYSTSRSLRSPGAINNRVARRRTWRARAGCWTQRPARPARREPRPARRRCRRSEVPAEATGTCAPMGPTLAAARSILSSTTAAGTSSFPRCTSPPTAPSLPERAWMPAVTTPRRPTADSGLCFAIAGLHVVRFGRASLPGPGPGHGTCICQAATSPDGGAAPFWFCE